VLLFYDLDAFYGWAGRSLAPHIFALSRHDSRGHKNARDRLMREDELLLELFGCLDSRL
jgi:hypothetical protein